MIKVLFTDNEPDSILGEDVTTRGADVRDYDSQADLIAEFPDFEIIGSSATQPEKIVPRNVPVRRFVQQLLGVSVYGSLRIARLGLQDNFQKNIATEQDLQILGALEAAADLMKMGMTIDLNDPMVSTILDIAIAIPAVPFDADDKARVLSNTAI